MARKIFYIDEKVADSIYKLGLMGKTNAEIANFLGVAERTLYNHLQKNPNVMQSLKVARARADADVVASLYQRACGFTKQIPGGTLQYFPPDVTAAIFWLKNRQPDKWRDVQKQETDIMSGGKPIRPVFVFKNNLQVDNVEEDVISEENGEENEKEDLS